MNTTQPAPGQIWVRKRDKTRVCVDRVNRLNVEYTTLPELLVYTVRRMSFLKNYKQELSAC